MDFKSVGAGVLASLCAVSAAGGNLLSNPGFENGASGWGNYDKKAWRAAPGEGENGTTAMLYELKEGSASTQPRQKVKLVPGKSYRYSVRVRHENLHKEDNRDNGVQICLMGTDASGKQTCGRYSQGMRGTSDGWYEMWELLYDVPSNTVEATFFVSVYAGVKGKAWFDNAKVEEYVPPVVESLHSSAYRNCAWTGDVTFAAALTVPPDKLNGAKGEFAYADKDGVRRTAKADALDASTATVKLGVSALAQGKQTVEFVLRDSAGKELGRAHLPFERLKSRPRNWHVWIDENRMMCIRGRRFFPIGVYYSAKSVEEGMRLLEDIPINTFHCYGVPTPAALDACVSNGVRVIPGVNNMYAGSRAGMKKGILTLEDQRNHVRNRVNPVKDHRGVIAWYLNDEPRPILAEKMADQQRFFEELDPSRPTCSTFDHPEYVRGFMKGFDILDTDPYPIGRWPLREVLDWCDFFRSGALAVKPLWLTPQAFNWKWFRMGKTMADAHMPSKEELGSMAWQGIVAGATGINFYGPGHFFRDEHASDRAENLAVLRHVVKELRKLSPVLLSTDEAMSLEGDPSPLRTRTWRFNGDDYVLVVNPEPKPVKASLKLPGSFARGCIEAGGGLTLSGGNSIDVDFGPLGYGVIHLSGPSRRLVFAGDSLLAKSSIPNRGSWGEMLAPHLAEGFEAVNFAKGGMSTRTYRNNGYWDNVMAFGREGDHVIISFGHNDSSLHRPDRAVVPEMYVRNLVKFAEEARAKGMKPVFVTPVATGTFAKDGSYYDKRNLAKYEQSMKQAASEARVPVVDLFSATLSKVRELGKEKSKHLYMASVDGKDYTHTTAAGAKMVKELFLRAAKESGLEFLGRK